MNKSKILAVVLSIFFCANSAALLAAESKEAVARKAFMESNSYRDPSSAQFRGLFWASKTMLCGEVNLKNGYGAYVGFRYFMVKREEVFKGSYLYSSNVAEGDASGEFMRNQCLHQRT